MKGANKMTSMYDEDRDYEQYDDKDYKYGKGFVNSSNTSDSKDDDDFEDDYWMWRIARK